MRRLIADTGAGNRVASFEFLLDESDCLRASGKLMGQVQLGGAYVGLFRVYAVPVQIPSMQFIDTVPVAAVNKLPHGFDGIAGFKFLNRFHYGNFNDRDRFGLE